MTSPTSPVYAPWIDTLTLEGAFTVFAKAKALEAQGKSIVHLEIGEPDFDTPKHIRDAAIRSIEAGDTHYAPSPGLPELRQTVAEHISKTRQVPVTAEEVFITPGTKALIFFAILILVQKGDEVIIPAPAYPTYESLVRFVGATPIFIPLHEKKNFRFDIKQLEAKITPKTRLVILNSPHNPTGGVLTAEDMAAVAHLSKKHDIFVLSDEIYSRLVYDAPFSSYLHSKEQKSKTILVDGFSKAFAMTGWRLGFGVMPPWLVSLMTRFMNNSMACTCTFVQKAGIAALSGPEKEIQEMVGEFNRRRILLIEGLNQLPGFRCHQPEGAFYAFPNIQGTNMGSQALSELLLNEAGVATLAGTAFGAAGEGFLRFSYANSIENIQKALRLMREVLLQTKG